MKLFGTYISRVEFPRDLKNLRILPVVSMCPWTKCPPILESDCSALSRLTTSLGRQYLNFVVLTVKRETCALNISLPTSVTVRQVPSVLTESPFLSPRRIFLHEIDISQYCPCLSIFFKAPVSSMMPVNSRPPEFEFYFEDFYRLSKSPRRGLEHFSSPEGGDHSVKTILVTSSNLHRGNKGR